MKVPFKKIPPIREVLGDMDPYLVTHLEQVLKDHEDTFGPIKNITEQLDVLDEYLKDCAEHVRYVQNQQ